MCSSDLLKHRHWLILKHLLLRAVVQHNLPLREDSQPHKKNPQLAPQHNLPLKNPQLMLTKKNLQPQEPPKPEP
jgi:hypothetical protein